MLIRWWWHCFKLHNPWCFPHPLHFCLTGCSVDFEKWLKPGCCAACTVLCDWTHLNSLELSVISFAVFFNIWTFPDISVGGLPSTASVQNVLRCWRRFWINCSSLSIRYTCSFWCPAHKMTLGCICHIHFKLTLRNIGNGDFSIWVRISTHVWTFDLNYNFTIHNAIWRNSKPLAALVIWDNPQSCLFILLAWNYTHIIM